MMASPTQINDLILRPATSQDLTAIHTLLLPLEQQGVLLPRTLQRLKQELGDFYVHVQVQIDRVVSCVALHLYVEDNAAELAALAVHPDFRNRQLGSQLLIHLEQQLPQTKINRLFTWTVAAHQWFEQRGFIDAMPNEVPHKLWQHHNNERNCSVLVKHLAT